jgi:two-component system response regulator HydG
MVVQDHDGVLGLDDLQEGDGLPRLTPADGAPVGVGGLVGQPLQEVERYYIEQALNITNGNREEAARMLGIGERTLYRVIQEWKLKDKIRQALTSVGGDPAAAAKALGIKEGLLLRKMKKWGLQEK